MFLGWIDSSPHLPADLWTCGWGGLSRISLPFSFPYATPPSLQSLLIFYIKPSLMNHWRSCLCPTTQRDQWVKYCSSKFEQSNDGTQPKPMERRAEMMSPSSAQFPAPWEAERKERSEREGERRKYQERSTGDCWGAEDRVSWVDGRSSEDVLPHTFDPQAFSIRLKLFSSIYSWVGPEHTWGENRDYQEVQYTPPLFISVRF